MLGRESLPMWPIREWRLREVKGLAQGHIKLKLEPRPLVSQQKSAHCITLPCGSGWATFLVHYDTPSPLTYQAVFQRVFYRREHSTQSQETCSNSSLFIEQIFFTVYYPVVEI